MNGSIIGFIIWAVVSAFFVGAGIHSFFSKKAVGFWANSKQYPVKNVKKYNHAVGKLFIVYGIVLLVLGLPLLCGQNSPLIFVSVIGVMLETIVIMAVYAVVITPKYKEETERNS